MVFPTDVVRFNVGGRVFETTATTLANAGRDSFFGAMFDDGWNLRSSITGEAGTVRFVDRNPDCFAVLLDLLRSGDLCLTAAVPERLLLREAAFYGLLPHVRAAKWGAFDGNRIRLARSVAGHAPGDGTAVRASPDGGCCVAHGSVVHVYDWALEEHAPITLGYQRVNDVAWLGASNVAVSVAERPLVSDGGVGVFDASSAELRQKLEVSHGGNAKSFTAGALEFDAEQGRLFAACRGRSNEYGIGAWDPETGALTDFFYEQLGWPLGDADKLQWVAGKNCLLVSTLFPRKDNCYISLVDFRAKKVVWNWSDMGASTADEKRVRDAISMEASSSICVVNEFEELGFIDLRLSFGNLRWSSRRSRLLSAKTFDEPCYPKLALHGGQLFSSMNDCISVFCGPEWVLTSRLRSSYGGSICDFSINGDRLFALRSEENVFDVWETPPSPVM